MGRIRQEDICAGKFFRASEPYLRQLVISLSHGAEWKTLISTYIGTIPVNGDASCAPTHSIPGMPPSPIPASSAMMAKPGAAARDSACSRSLRRTTSRRFA
jgi:hypothetical protein